MGYVWAIVAVYGLVGFVAFLATIGIVRNHDRRGNDAGAAWVHSPLHWILPVWAGPFVLWGLLYVLTVFVREGIPYLRRNPPLKRVVESSPDIREVHKRDV